MSELYVKGWRVMAKTMQNGIEQIRVRSRTYSSRHAADTYLALYRRENPHEEAWVSEVIGRKELGAFEK